MCRFLKSLSLQIHCYLQQLFRFVVLELLIGAWTVAAWQLRVPRFSEIVRRVDQVGVVLESRLFHRMRSSVTFWDSEARCQSLIRRKDEKHRSASIVAHPG